MSFFSNNFERNSVMFFVIYCLFNDLYVTKHADTVFDPFHSSLSTHVHNYLATTKMIKLCWFELLTSKSIFRVQNVRYTKVIVSSIYMVGQ